MSILGEESYAAVCHLVTDVEVLSREERNHVLWYACDGGDLSMGKSVIKAGCDVDHFHRGHTPLMMASIRGYDDVRELILAGCKVDLQSSKCSVGWFRFITKMASAWPAMLVWAVTTLFMTVTSNVWVEMVCYWMLVLTIALHFLGEDSFKVSQMLRMEARIRYMAWEGIVPATALLWSVVRTAVPESHLLLPMTVLVVVVVIAVLMAVTGVLTVVKGVERTGSGTVAAVVTVAAAGTKI